MSCPECHHSLAAHPAHDDPADAACHCCGCNRRFGWHQFPQVKEAK